LRPDLPAAQHRRNAITVTLSRRNGLPKIDRWRRPGLFRFDEARRTARARCRISTGDRERHQRHREPDAGGDIELILFKVFPGISEAD
jgi:hypothetical protein